MADTDADQQLTSLRLRLGEPSDATQARFTTAQLLDLLNEGRRKTAAATRCRPVEDSQVASPPTDGSPSVFSIPDDLIWVEEVTYDGRPLRLVRTADWSDVVGKDDTIQGDPVVYKFHARQITIFRAVTDSGLTLAYKGWGYPASLASAGVDSDFVKGVSDVTIWLAAMMAKAIDDRSYDFERQMALEGYADLKKQYGPRGPRYVRTGDLFVPWRPLL